VIVFESLDSHRNPKRSDMRYDPEQKTQTHQRIVRNAARSLRAKGVSGAGVAGIMKASGLTVGGFYKHFRSKDELLAEAIAQGFSEFDERFRTSLQDVPQEDRWKEIVRWYLSPEHCSHPETGCPVTALAADISRTKVTVRRRIAELLKKQNARLAEFMPGATAEEREQNTTVIFSAMSGALAVARILTEQADRKKVLETTRDYLLRSF
jgi:TetR/AcrR family transcriptional repressor of nem operon